jgi:hypothetical protein
MSSKSPARCYLRPESCASIGEEKISTSAKPAPARFGNRKRAWAAVGRCYACDALASGVAPRGVDGGPYNPRKPHALRQACDRHAWAEYRYRGAKRPASLTRAPAAPCYAARPLKTGRLLSSGFEIVRLDLGEVLCHGRGAADLEFWHPRSGEIVTPRKEALEALYRGRAATYSAHEAESECEGWLERAVREEERGQTAANG